MKEKYQYADQTRADGSVGYGVDNQAQVEEDVAEIR
jgi:hypothetical protein